MVAMNFYTHAGRSAIAELVRAERAKVEAQHKKKSAGQKPVPSADPPDFLTDIEVRMLNAAIGANRASYNECSRALHLVAHMDQFALMMHFAKQGGLRDHSAPIRKLRSILRKMAAAGVLDVPRPTERVAAAKPAAESEITVMEDGNSIADICAHRRAAITPKFRL